MTDKRMKKRRKPHRHTDTPAPADDRSEQVEATTSPENDVTPNLPLVIGAGVVLFLATVWAYWPTVVWMEGQWRNEPDYSHGYLVIPLAALLAYMRFDLAPKLKPGIYLGGIGLLLLAIAARVLGRLAYMDFMDGWTISLWVAGIVWLFMGRETLVWALPSIAFLLLLVPLPYQMESMLSWKLQGLATTVSVAMLQIFGFPAIADGHTIWLDDSRMMVEDACSGLRIFVGMGAMGYLFATLSRRAWVDKAVILCSALPIAIIVNIIRVAATVLAYHWFSDSTAKQIHDFFGIVMIILGAIFLAFVKWYWEHLYRPVTIPAYQSRLAVDS